MRPVAGQAPDGCAHVGAERRAGRWRGSAPGRTSRPAANRLRAEVGHEVPALVLEGNRRHRHEDVVGQQGNQGVEVGRLVRAGEPAPRSRPRRASRARAAADGRRRSRRRSQGGPGPLERAGDRLDGGVQHPGHLAGAEPEDVAQDEHGELARRQHLQGGHEGQGDGLGLLVAGLRARRHAGPRPPAGRRGTARARRPRPGGSARAARCPGCSTPWRAAGWPCAAR